MSTEIASHDHFTIEDHVINLRFACALDEYLISYVKLRQARGVQRARRHHFGAERATLARLACLNEGSQQRRHLLDTTRAIFYGLRLIQNVRLLCRADFVIGGVDHVTISTPLYCHTAKGLRQKTWLKRGYLTSITITDEEDGLRVLHGDSSFAASSLRSVPRLTSRFMANRRDHMYSACTSSHGVGVGARQLEVRVRVSSLALLPTTIVSTLLPRSTTLDHR